MATAGPSACVRCGRLEDYATFFAATRSFDGQVGHLLGFGSVPLNGGIM